jgi:hypothetical protein
LQVLHATKVTVLNRIVMLRQRKHVLRHPEYWSQA